MLSLSVVQTLLRIMDSKPKKEAACFGGLILCFKLFYFIWELMFMNILGASLLPLKISV